MRKLFKKLFKRTRKYTTEEIREQFIDHINMLVDYWENNSRTTISKEKLRGLAFSILVTIDGEDGTLPAYVLAPCSTRRDKKFYISRGEKYYPINNARNVRDDIGGCLHERFMQSEIKKNITAELNKS